MITRLYIKNCLSFKKVDLEFNSGLNIFTGPSGAGKSILMREILASFGLEFKVTQDSGAVVIIDGQELYDLEKDEIIKIKIATKKAKMLHRSSRDFFKVLSEKLRWGN